MKNITATAAVSFLLSFTVHAKPARYLVKIKSPTTFNSIVVQMRKSTPMFFRSPRVSGFQLLNQKTSATEALENLGMLVVESEQAVSELQNNPAVEYVEQEVWHPLPELAGKNIALSGTSQDADPVPTPWGILAVHAPEVWPITKGSGIRVMVLDTGVDKEHPALKSRFLKGRNFVGDDQGEDDVTDSVGHGTHVSGTILASGENDGLVGVAPEAQLEMGRVCDDDGCSSIAIVEGVNWAVEEGVQILSLSLTGPATTPGEMDAFATAEKANLVVIAASGNDSEATVGYPAALPTLLAVGAVDENSQRAVFSNYGPELGLVAPGVDVVSSVPRGMGRGSAASLGATKLATADFQGVPIGAVNDSPLAFCGFGSVAETQAAGVSGKVALVSRGNGLSFNEKALNAIAAGATAIVIYNDAPGFDRVGIAPEGSEIAKPAVMISQTDGENLRAALAAGTNPLISVAVKATDYASNGGTSMATPHVAGVAALVRAANPGLSAAEVRALLKDTATSIVPNDRNQYGSGLVNAKAAVARAQQIVATPIKLANGF